MCKRIIVGVMAFILGEQWLIVLQSLGVLVQTVSYVTCVIDFATLVRIAVSSELVFLRYSPKLARAQRLTKLPGCVPLSV